MYQNDKIITEQRPNSGGRPTTGGRPTNGGNTGGGTPSLQSWVPGCIINNFKLPGIFANVPNKDEVFYTDGFKDKWYFNKNGNFKFERLSNGEVFTGSWECESDGNCLIKTTENNKQMSTKDMKWVDQPSRSGGGARSGKCPSLTTNQKKPENFFTVKYPGDTKYSYGKDTNGIWFAINNETKIQFNLTVCGYKKNINRLNNITKREDGSQNAELDNVKSAPNDKVNIAVVEPKTEPKPLPDSDKIIDGQMEFMSDTNGL